MRDENNGNRHLFWQLGDKTTIGAHPDACDVYLPPNMDGYAVLSRRTDSNEFYVGGQNRSSIALLSPGFQYVEQHIGPVHRIAKIDRFTHLFVPDNFWAQTLNKAIAFGHPFVWYEAAESEYKPLAGDAELHDGDVIRFGHEGEYCFFRFRQ